MVPGSNCVYLQSHDLRMTPAGLSEEERGKEREGRGLFNAHNTHTHARTHTYTYTRTHVCTHTHTKTS